MKEKYSIDNLRVAKPQEHLRLRPGLYFEEVFTQGHLNNLAIETSCHAIDEFFDGNCTYIRYKVNEKEFSLSYDAGISMEEPRNGSNYKAEIIFSMMMACHNMKKHLAIGDEFCRLGVALVQFASDWCTVRTVSEGKQGIFKFEKGRFVSVEVSGASDQPDSTEIKTKMDPEIFNDLQFDAKTLNELLVPLREKLTGLSLEIIQSSI